MGGGGYTGSRICIGRGGMDSSTALGNNGFRFNLKYELVSHFLDIEALYSQTQLRIIPSKSSVLECLHENINILQKVLDGVNKLGLYVFELADLMCSVLSLEIPDARQEQRSADIGYRNKIGDIGEAPPHLCLDDAGARFSGVNTNGLGWKWKIRVCDGTNSWVCRFVRDGRVGDERSVD